MASTNDDYTSSSVKKENADIYAFPEKGTIFRTSKELGEYMNVVAYTRGNHTSLCFKRTKNAEYVRYCCNSEMCGGSLEARPITADSMNQQDSMNHQKQGKSSDDSMNQQKQGKSSDGLMNQQKQGKSSEGSMNQQKQGKSWLGAEFEVVASENCKCPVVVAEDSDDDRFLSDENKHKLVGKAIALVTSRGLGPIVEER